MKVLIEDPDLAQEMFKPATPGSAGIYLRACITESKTLYAGDTQTILTGIRVAIPKGWVGLVTPKSGLGRDYGIVLGNLVGAIDSDYRGVIEVPLWNRNVEGKPYVIKPYSKIAQLIVVPYYSHQHVEFVTKLDNTERGENGFGSTGL